MAHDNYRLCILNFEGNILFSRTVACRDDLQALEQAEQDCAGHAVEVWQGARLVARVKADNAPLDVKDATCP